MVGEVQQPEWGMQLGESLDNIHPLEKQCKTWCWLSSLLGWHYGRVPKGKETEWKQCCLYSGRENSTARRQKSCSAELEPEFISH